MNRFLLPLLLSFSLVLGACASAPPQPQTQIGPSQTLGADEPAVFEYEEVIDPDTDFAIDVHDPFESFNRGVYRFNASFDRAIFIPVTELYDFLLPTFAQERVTNFFSNLSELSTFANSILQGKFERASRALVRFAVNSTVGVAGFFDPMTSLGTAQQREDFGQTLGVWGAGEGPFLVLPVLGPSNLRDTAGLIGDFAAYQIVDPFGLASFEQDNGWMTAIRAIETRHGIEFRYHETGSPFEYELVRLLYTEKRRLDIAK